LDMHAPLLAEDSRAFAYNRLQASIEVVARRKKINKRYVQTPAALPISQSAQVTSQTGQPMDGAI
jgi:hypothetical protein